MRNAFADELSKLATNDERVTLLSGDIGNRMFDRYKESFPTRFYNCGIAESNMMGVAAGMALSGLRPFIYTIAPFTTTRCYEQIRVDVCYHNVPVVIVGTGAGLTYAELGPTHHSCEDIAIMRALPNMTVLAPADSTELRSCLQQSLQLDGPVYIRIGKKGEPTISQGSKLKIGKASLFRGGGDVCLIGTGTIMPTLIEAAELLAKQGVEAQVVNMHTLKPLDEAFLERCFKQFSTVGIVEEHSVIGGLGSAVSEWVVDHQVTGAKLLKFAVADEFIHEVGSQEYMRMKFGLTAENISKAMAANINSLGGI